MPIELITGAYTPLSEEKQKELDTKLKLAAQQRAEALRIIRAASDGNIVASLFEDWARSVLIR
jgi:hypothetical protein